MPAVLPATALRLPHMHPIRRAITATVEDPRIDETLHQIGTVAEARRKISRQALEHDLELAGDGRIWLADAGNNRVLLLSEALEIEHELSGAPYHFDGVRYLDVWPDGTLVAADKYSHSIKFIDASGRLLATLGTGEAGLGAGVFRTPEGVDSAADRLWLSDSGNDRVVVYRVMR